jgi:hypothetical protein
MYEAGKHCALVLGDESWDIDEGSKNSPRKPSRCGCREVSADKSSVAVSYLRIRDPATRPRLDF